MRTFYYLLVMGIFAVNSVTAQEEGTFQIRTYSVPVEHQQAIEFVLGQAVSVALGRRDQRSVGVDSPGPGQILVTAPAHIHEDIVRFLADFEPVETINLKTEYWIVRGQDGEASTPAQNLSDIREVLDTIIAAQGPMSFSLIENVQIQSSAGASAHARFPYGEIHQELSYFGEKIIGQFDLRTPDNSLETEIAIVPGQFIVLGRSGLRPPSDDSNGNDAARASSDYVFYILRAQID